MVGIICDISYTRHHLFQSYYHSVKNLYGVPKIVKTVQDLDGIEMLFIGDDHYQVHKEIWQQKGFIEKCNSDGIRVIVFTNERILDSFFPWNKDNLLILQRFERLYHYGNDVDDCEKLGMKLNRQSMSKNFKSDFSNIEKKNKVVFIGKTYGSSYKERRVVLEQIRRVIEVDVIESVIPDWNEYMKTIAGYRFVLSPIGNGNFFPMRVYEALSVGSIPIHQIRGNTLELYNIERGYDDCIFFINPRDVRKKIRECTLARSHNMIWMEDNIGLLLKQDNLWNRMI